MAIQPGARSRFEEAVEAALTQLDRVELSREGRIRILNFVRNNHSSETRNYEPEEQRIADGLFAEQVTAICRALELFRGAIVPDRKTEALVALDEFLNHALAGLAGADFDVIERKLTALSYERNRLSAPRPPVPLDEWLRRAAALWSSLEAEMLEIELRRDDTSIENIDRWGATTISGRRIDRAKLRQDAAPLVEPYRTKFLERLPAIHDLGNIRGSSKLS